MKRDESLPTASTVPAMVIVSTCAVVPSVADADEENEVPVAFAVRDISPLLVPAYAVTLAAMSASVTCCCATVAPSFSLADRYAFR